MSYYDQYKIAYGCYKWGNFRQHCRNECETGETCGIRFVKTIFEKEDSCKVCQKIQTKLVPIQKEKEPIKRWKRNRQKGFDGGFGGDNGKPRRRSG